MQTFREFVEKQNKKEEPEKPDGHHKAVSVALEKADNLNNYYGVKHLGPSPGKHTETSKTTTIKFMGKPKHDTPHPPPTHVSVTSNRNKHGKWDHKVIVHNPDGSSHEHWATFNSKD